MDTEARIVRALEDIGLPVVPNIYKGNALTYIVFQYDSIPESFAEGTAVGVRELVGVHLYLPTGDSPVSLKRRIITALLAAGATYPTVTNASDDECQHYAFDCEMLQDG